MAEFFSKYPKIVYNKQLVTDILSRVVLRSEYANKVQLYYEYEMQDGDTPEIIAHKYYGDPEKNWIILFMNEIIDPQQDLPLSYNGFMSYLDAKYKTLGDVTSISGSDYAKMTLNPAPFSYIVDIVTTDPDTGTITTNQIYIDEISYAGEYDNPIFNYNTSSNLVTYNKREITIYDYEYQLNDSKRMIKLLQLQYVNQFTRELESLLKIKYV